MTIENITSQIASSAIGGEYTFRGPAKLTSVGGSAKAQEAVMRMFDAAMDHGLPTIGLGALGAAAGMVTGDPVSLAALGTLVGASISSLSGGGKGKGPTRA